MTFWLPVLTIGRPLNALITMISVLVAIIITGPLEPLPAVVLACLSAGAITLASNTINDYFDVEIDRINRPMRPIPSGRISLRQAFNISMVEYTVGILLAAAVSWPVFLIAAVFSGVAYLYSAYLKRTVLWGNLTVSVTTAMAFIFAGAAVGRVPEAVIPAIFAFFFHFGREVIKDMEDMEGDRKNGVITLPIRHGLETAARLTTIIFLILMGLTLIPYAGGWYGWRYLVVIIAGVFPVLLYCIISMRKKRDAQHLGFLSNLLKADMLVGLFAIYLQ